MKRPDAGGDPRGATLADRFRAAGVTLPEAAQAPPSPPAAAPVAYSFAKKVVVRATRKGHGGKTVTEVLGVTGGHEALIAALKAGFGVGVRQEGDAVVLQGDQVTRLVPWLERLVPRVIRG